MFTALKYESRKTLWDLMQELSYSYDEIAKSTTTFKGI